ALQAIESFYASAPEVRRQEFRTFVQRLFARYPGMQALSWDRRVPEGERSAYEAAMRQEGSPAFQITEQNAQGHLVVLCRNNPSLYTVNVRTLYVHLNGLAIVLLK